MANDRTKGPLVPDFSELAEPGGTGRKKTADWTDIESRTPTLPFQRDGVFGTADWSGVAGANGTEDWTGGIPEGTEDWSALACAGKAKPRKPGTEDWSFEPGTGVDAPRGGDGVAKTADWSDLLD